MKFLSILFIFASFNLSAQLISGDLVDEKRNLLSTTDFLLVGNSSGELFYDLSVDIEGNVTSAKLLIDKTTVLSTPTRMRGKLLVSDLKFEPGTYYPKFHHVVVRIKVVLETIEK